MRIVTEEQLARLLSSIRPRRPRVVASGNAATPSALLSILDAAIAEYRLFSTIVPRLDAPATSFQQSYVVTEHGTARCGAARSGNRRRPSSSAPHTPQRAASCGVQRSSPDCRSDGRCPASRRGALLPMNLPRFDRPEHTGH
jgi:hypothetical protein